MLIIKEKINKLTNKPGCYLFKDKAGEIIYIGKAKNLKKRVSSYFLKNRDLKTTNLVADIFDLDLMITDNEIEALLLEAQLIKENQPKYNLDLKGGILKRCSTLVVRFAIPSLTNHLLLA